VKCEAQSIVEEQSWSTLRHIQVRRVHNEVLQI